MNNTFKHYARRIKNDAKDLRTYLELTFEGDVVEKETDFTKKVLKPVLLLHGFGTTRKSVSILEGRLRDDKFDVFSMDLGGFMGRFNTRGIDTLAEVVKEKIELLQEKFHIGKIAIVGHSKGGLIGRYYVTFLGGDKNVHMLITLGTPHGGSWLALFASLTVVGIVARSVWQMIPYSRFMKRLNGTLIPSSVRMFSIYSTDDTVTSPEKGKYNFPAGTTHIKNIQLEGYTHTDYLVKTGVYEVVFNCLNV